ncbi:hypothetical protein GCM10010435_23240 [Winogradskya consettensis]|uniref:hypothetical protein n=1 Tax=Winogradskya consettensis TaxID=113560 RepID=UPI001BB3345D|nr:hypothetical protein [Actinoplanes consettensis]
MRRSHVLVAAIAVAALTGCGSPQQAEAPAKNDAKVATLVSAAPSAKPSPTSQRPRERLDTTSEEYEALLAPYNKCMKEHGVDTMEKRKLAQDAAARPATSAEEEKLTAASKICEPQYFPLPPWEKDPANPEARDFAVAVVKCLKGKGVKYVEVADDGLSYALGGDQNDPESISKGMDLAPDCEREVAAKK